MSEYSASSIRLRASDGAVISAYRVTPARPARAGVVVVQEVFGVNAHIRKVAESYAQEGYDVIAPAFFDRVEPNVEFAYDADGIARGRSLVQSIGFDAALRDVSAAIAELAPCGPVGIVGYCWGGSVAYLAAARAAGLTAAVGYYGSAIAKFVDEAPRVPTLLHFGAEDKGIPLADVELIRARRPEVAVHLYDAGHGFHCDARASYDEASARLAHRRTLAFFADQLVQ